MKKRLVLWGSNEKDDKLLLALELKEKENKVNVYCVPEALATEGFYKTMMNDWRENREIEFPEGVVTVVRELSVTANLLPDDIKTDRTDLIHQAKAEWHFMVLSSKLYEFYTSELDTIKEKVDQLTQYDGAVWDEIKSFWTKVRNHMNDENLFKGHGYKLKKSTNEIFDKLKELRKEMDAELNKASAIVKKEFMSSLEIIETKIDKGLGLQPIFNELKKLQNEFRKSEFSRSDKNKVWKRLDKAFKLFKEKKYGNQASSGNSEMDHLKNRYNGLINAISRMEQTLNRDKRDKAFQNKRINDTFGQLELQLRQAKMMMIDQRLASKQERLDDMLATKVELEKKIKQLEAKMEVKAQQKIVEQKKAEVKAKIEKELEENKESLKVDAEKLTKAASDIKESKKRTKKTKPPVDDKKEEKGEEPSDKKDSGISEVISDIIDKVEDIVEGVTKKVGDIVEVVEEKVENVVEVVEEKVESIVEVVEEKVEDIIDDVKGEEE